MTHTDKIDALTFEEAMAQLEKIVTDLESGDLTLDRSLEMYESGMKLSGFCAKKLDETEKKITLLSENTSDNRDEKAFFGTDNDSLTPDH